jgi:hypothetical protein
MAHKLIETKHYLLVVDDSDMVGKGYRLDITRMSVGIIDDDFLYNARKDWFKKIIAHLPLNGSPILEGVDLLPPYSRHQEDGVEEAEKAFTEVLDSETKQVYDKILLDATEHGFIVGYNKAREKYKYTEKDIRKAIDMATTSKHDSTLIFFNAEEIIQSLHQYPTEFECEMKYFEVDMGLGEECIEHGQIPQKITTAQGVQWVGKYK